MLMYKTTAVDKDQFDSRPTVVSWHSSADAASKHRTSVKSDGFKATTEAVRVATSKDGLLTWLNENVKC